MNKKEKRPQFATPSAKTKIRKNPYRKSSAVKELEAIANIASVENSNRKGKSPNDFYQKSGIKKGKNLVFYSFEEFYHWYNVSCGRELK